MFRLVSPIGIQRNTYDGQAKACWGVVQVGYTRFMFRKLWFKDQEKRPVFWLRLFAPSDYRRRWFYLNLAGKTLININPESGYCGR